MVAKRVALGERVAGPVILMVVAILLLLQACKQEAPPPPYQAVPVERRDIVVSAQASGAVQPDTTVEVKSKASGEILELAVETGQTVKRGALMVRVDPRIPRNAVAQAQADLEVAQARLTNATSQRRRADQLFKSQSITFLIEALTLCLLGGVLGILLGVGTAVLLSRVMQWNTLISPIAITVAFGFSAAVGLFFGLWPARRASRLDSIVALRYE